MFFVLGPGQKATGFAHSAKEIHEVGEALIPLFLSIHGGACVGAAAMTRKTGAPAKPEMALPYYIVHMTKCGCASKYLQTMPCLFSNEARMASSGVFF
jgi:hypothetical protein